MPSTNRLPLACFVLAILVIGLGFTARAQTDPAAASTPVGPANLADRLLLDLPCTDNLTDLSTNRLPVTIHGDVSIDSGAAWFPDGTGWLELPTLPFNQPFAIALALKPDADGLYGLVEQHQLNHRNQLFHIMLRKDMQPHLGFFENDVDSPQSIPSGEWTRLVFQYTGTHQEIWVNGRLMCSRLAAPYEGTTGPTRIGKNPGWRNIPARNFKGYLNHLRIYGRALTAEEIGKLAGLPPAYAHTTRPVGTTNATPGATNLPVATALNFSSAITTRPPPPFISIDGNRVCISGTVGETYLLQAANSLTSPWQDLATLKNETGEVEYTDDAAAGHIERFYRVEITAQN